MALRLPRHSLGVEGLYKAASPDSRDLGTPLKEENDAREEQSRPPMGSEWVLGMVGQRC